MSDNIFELPFYVVRVDYAIDTDYKYEGTDYEKALKEYNSINVRDNESKHEEPTVTLEKKINEYKFIGELDLELEETIEETYPVELYYKDKDVYQSHEEGEPIEYLSKKLRASEASANDLDYEVRQYLNKVYNREHNASYDQIVIGYDKEDPNDNDAREITMQIRVKDHSENPANKQRSTADHFLSIVIANKNETRQRFHSSTELYFDGDDTIDYVKDEVFNYIQDIIEYDSKIVSLPEYMIEAGHELTMADGGEVKNINRSNKIVEKLIQKSHDELNQELNRGGKGTIQAALSFLRASNETVEGNGNGKQSKNEQTKELNMTQDKIDELVDKYTENVKQIIIKEEGEGNVNTDAIKNGFYKLIQMIDSKDYLKLKDTLWSANTNSKKFFTEYTGIKLDKTDKETFRILKEYTNYVEPAQPKQEPKLSKEDALDKMRKAKDEATLSKQVNYSGYGVMTRKRFIETVLNEGGRLSTEQVKKIKNASRRQYNKMDNREQYEFDKRQQEAGLKTEYQIHLKGGSYYEITKAEYDYGIEYLKEIKGVWQEDEVEDIGIDLSKMSDLEEQIWNIIKKDKGVAYPSEKQAKKDLPYLFSKELIQYWNGSTRDKGNNGNVRITEKGKSFLNSDLSKAIEIETEHKQTLEDVASGKLTPDEAIIETVKDHLEESPDYYDSEKGLPAMEERLKNKTLYHGTYQNNSFDRFDLSKANKGVSSNVFSQGNNGVYLTDNLNAARYFSRKANELRYLTDKSIDPIKRTDLATDSLFGDNATSMENVISVSLQDAKIKELSYYPDKEDILSIIKEEKFDGVKFMEKGLTAAEDIPIDLIDGIKNVNTYYIFNLDTMKIDKEISDYKGGEKGLPAMEERLKEDDNMPTETYGSLQLQINDLHKEISKRSDLIRQGQLDRFGILQKEFDDLSNERNILIRKQDNLLKLKSKPAMEERLKSESELNKNDRVMTTDEVEISASEVKPWDYIKIELSKDDFKHVVVRKIEDRGDYVLFFNETRSDNDIKIRKTRKVILVERGRKPIENGVFIEEFDYPNGKVDYVADVYYNGYEKRTSHHLDKKHTQVEGDMIYQELIKKYNESESKQLPEYALLFNDRLVKRYGEDSTQADKDNLRSQYIRELDRGYLKSLVQKGDISQQWADRVLESAELKTNTVPPVDDRLKKEMLKDICLNADKEKKTLILDVLEEDVELYKSFGFKIIG